MTLDHIDAERLARVAAETTLLDVARLLDTATGTRCDAAVVAAISAECSADHSAILVFPDEVTMMPVALRSHGLKIIEITPSVIVRDRLARRYDLDPEELAVTIIRAGAAASRAHVEIFCVPRARATVEMITRERDENNESHLAINVDNPSTAVLRGLSSLLHDELGMHSDGGGHTPHHNGETHGRTVLYFRSPRGKRLELCCDGDFRDVSETHRLANDAPHALLTLLSGHWIARAVHAAAQTGIVDTLENQPVAAEEIARRLAADVESVSRLARFLSHLGVLRQSGFGYTAGPIGELLRDGNPFRDLTLLYGQEFHQAWGEFAEAVESGHNAFEIAFGVGHFDYFAAHPAAARRFDRAMSAVCDVVASAIATAYPFPPGASVVDVGGGDGTVVAEILEENPAVSGVVFDLGHVVERVVIAAEKADRMTVCAGDFFGCVPGGHDVYLMSRVLHDWNDEDCLRILNAYRSAARPDSTLLIVERLLPDDGRKSFAWASDMQMLAITGGKERSRADFSTLIDKVGLTVVNELQLPLDMMMLVCRTIRDDDSNSRTYPISTT